MIKIKRDKDLLESHGILYDSENSAAYEQITIAIPEYIYSYAWALSDAVDISQDFKDKLEIGADGKLKYKDEYDSSSNDVADDLKKELSDSIAADRSWTKYEDIQNDFYLHEKYPDDESFNFKSSKMILMTSSEIQDWLAKYRTPLKIPYWLGSYSIGMYADSAICALLGCAGYYNLKTSKYMQEDGMTESRQKCYIGLSMPISRKLFNPSGKTFISETLKHEFMHAFTDYIRGKYHGDAINDLDSTKHKKMVTIIIKDVCDSIASDYTEKGWLRLALGNYAETEFFKKNDNSVKSCSSWYMPDVSAIDKMIAFIMQLFYYSMETEMEAYRQSYKATLTQLIETVAERMSTDDCDDFLEFIENANIKHIKEFDMLDPEVQDLCKKVKDYGYKVTMTYKEIARYSKKEWKTLPYRDIFNVLNNIIILLYKLDCPSILYVAAYRQYDTFYQFFTTDVFSMQESYIQNFYAAVMQEVIGLHPDKTPDGKTDFCSDISSQSTLPQAAKVFKMTKSRLLPIIKKELISNHKTMIDCLEDFREYVLKSTIFDDPRLKELVKIYVEDKER